MKKFRRRKKVDRVEVKIWCWRFWNNWKAKILMNLKVFDGKNLQSWKISEILIILSVPIPLNLHFLLNVHHLLTIKSHLVIYTAIVIHLCCKSSSFSLSRALSSCHCWKFHSEVSSLFIHLPIRSLSVLFLLSLSWVSHLHSANLHHLTSDFVACILAGKCFAWVVCAIFIALKAGK